MMIDGAGAAIKAILLDMDGTLIDSDRAHHWAFSEVLAPHGVVLTEALYDQVVVGNNNDAIMRTLVPQLAADTRAQLTYDKEQLVLRNLDLIELGRGARELVKNTLHAGRALALVTNAPRENAIAILQHFDLLTSMSSVVAFEDTDAPKPAAAPYLEALRRLGVRACEAVAFEDSVAGVTAAVAAGIRVYAVRGYRPETALLQAGAFASIAALGDARFA